MVQAGRPELRANGLTAFLDAICGRIRGRPCQAYAVVQLLPFLPKIATAVPARRHRNPVLPNEQRGMCLD